MGDTSRAGSTANRSIETGFSRSAFVMLVAGLWAAARFVWDSWGTTTRALEAAGVIFAAFLIVVVFASLGVIIPGVFGVLRYHTKAVPVLALSVVAFVIVWLFVNGLYDWRSFVFSLAIALVVSGVLFSFERKKTAGANGANRNDTNSESREISESNRYSLILLLAWWLAYSALVWWLEGPPLALARADRPVEESWKGVRVGLALSGGGYRAALMHAGALHELRLRGVPVTHLSTVSGGSIIGAFYAVGGEPEQFRDAVAAGRLNPGRSLTTIQNAVRLPFPFQLPFTKVRLFPWYAFGRTDVQADLLDRVLFGGLKLSSVGDRVRLQICATDLRTGAAVGISSESTLMVSGPLHGRFTSEDTLAPTHERSRLLRELKEERLALLVAASGAFPGAFNAVAFPREGPRAANESEFLLSDAGLTDNLGIALLLERHYASKNSSGEWGIDLAIVSDGGQPFKEQDDPDGWLDELPRAVDIVYRNAAWHHEGQTPRPGMLFLRPSDVKDNEVLRQSWTIFADTKTLDATFKKRQAETLFALGRTLVDAQWQNLERMLNSTSNAMAARTSP